MWSRKDGKKFGNEKVDLDGHSFSSKLEASVYQQLKLRVAAGEIRILQVQDHVYLTLARILYVPDFRCEEIGTGAIFWVEAKGFAAPTWPLKKKLWKHYGPGALEIWSGTYTRPVLTETIIPLAGA